MFLLSLLLIVFLILLNAFFVLAEFAMVKMRPTQVSAMAGSGSRRARCLLYIQNHLDVFLSVCQVGITLASIGLGFVGEPAIERWIEGMFHDLGLGGYAEIARHGMAVTIAYIAVSALHIVLGELVPKSVAIRRTEDAALFIAYPMRVFHYLFIVPIWFLNGLVYLSLKALRIPQNTGNFDHTEDEIRIILDQSQNGGMMSFRRLLYIENVLDMATLTARSAMNVREKVVCLRVGMSMRETSEIIRRHRYSRYPLLERVLSEDGLEEEEKPIGYIHIKDLYVSFCEGREPELKALAKPVLTADEDQPLEDVLSQMQRKGNHLTLVYATGEADAPREWVGIVTLEDALEEVVGTIEEEYPLDTPLRLGDLVPVEQVMLQVPGASVAQVAREALKRLPAEVLPAPLDEVMAHIIERERMGGSYVGKHLALPHARMGNLVRPLVLVIRPAQPFAASLPGETVEILFLLLTPADKPRVHQQLLARVAGIFTSDFLGPRLLSAATGEELREAICVAEQSAIG